jgi:Na+/phosphate symporter|tara:strand:+ start:41 stop:307 length:267 start_codon:yes stop_codon:yes gene_type:complete
MNSNIQSKTNKRVDTSIKLLIETSSIQENIDDIINYIIHNHTTDTMKDNDNINVEKYQYLKKLYKYTNINYKIYNVNKYINYISENYI